MRLTLSRTTVVAAFALAFVFTLGSAPANAAIPQTLSYQGRLTDASGSPVADGTYTMRFRIYTGTTTSDFSLWSSGNQSVTTQNGLFSYVLGSNTPFPSDLFSKAPFADSVRYLGIKVGTDPEIRPLIRLEATAFAHVAETVSDNAITSAKIAPFTIANNDIADNAVETYVVKNNSLKAIDLFDEPGVASAITLATVAVSSTTGQLVDSVTLNAPTAGYAIVLTNGVFDLSHHGNIGFPFSKYSYLRATVSNQGVTAPNFFTTLTAVLSEADTAAFGSYRSPFSMTHTFRVTGAGQHTYYLWAQTGSLSTNSTISARSMTVIFVPTAYGAVALSAPPSPQDNTDIPVETRRIDNGENPSGRSLRTIQLQGNN